mmetsp:Transcript_20974/g.31664  ORF Transcript_20974/g.31664 Transcript_20974/m.31664 type:complete len:206 (+) Transcript_20974:659-1276(+)
MHTHWRRHIMTHWRRRHAHTSRWWSIRWSTTTMMMMNWRSSNTATAATTTRLFLNKAQKYRILRCTRTPCTTNNLFLLHFRRCNIIPFLLLLLLLLLILHHILLLQFLLLLQTSRKWSQLHTKFHPLLPIRILFHLDNLFFLLLIPLLLIILLDTYRHPIPLHLWRPWHNLHNRRIGQPLLLTRICQLLPYIQLSFTILQPIFLT